MTHTARARLYLYAHIFWQCAAEPNLSSDTPVVHFDSHENKSERIGNLLSHETSEVYTFLTTRCFRSREKYPNFSFKSLQPPRSSPTMKSPELISRSYTSPILRHYGCNNREEIPWKPVLERPCSFPSQIFLETMQDMILNPNYNTSWVLRADILFDSHRPENIVEESSVDGEASKGPETHVSVRHINMRGFSPARKLVRKFIPRNPERDRVSNQTCIFFEEEPAPEGLWKKRTLVVYLAHVSTAEELPYYLPAVKAVAFLHEENVLEAENQNKISIHYLPFEPSTPLTTRLERTALRLMERIIKVGNGTVNGYEKRVHHDLVIPRERSQDTYLKLRLRHAPRLMERWVEKTDPKKHVFEDILIAAFLVELWGDMYGPRAVDGLVSGGVGFPGFVDIGCGNGVLVDILLKEGYKGYGFDARKRMSWSTFDKETQECLFEKVLIPWMLIDELEKARSLGEMEGSEQEGRFRGVLGEGGSMSGIHDGKFGQGTFIISNHADELTGWTPLLSKAAHSPFLIIPCCSHDLSGHKHRHKSTKTANETAVQSNVGKIERATRIGTVSSEYASLVGWVTSIAEDVGYVVEREVLRIPSTRNIGLIGRVCNTSELSVDDVLEREGGGIGWAEKALALRKTQPQRNYCF